ncbi:MAG: NAD(P)H-dependent oxidoreductase subunit E [Clostridia bacterium]|nr:NAD(P)H-dependent oxidoreductase subunit E [Clostridia bacterium]
MSIIKLTPEEQATKLEAVLSKYRGQGQKALMATLQQSQEIYGYLPLDVQKKVADALEVSVAEVYGVVSFYSFFSLKPKGENAFSVCLGTACYVKGSQALLDKIESSLGIKVGDCTEDLKFSISACRCVGACGLAPVVLVNDEVYGRLKPEDIPGIIAKYKEEA